MVPDHGEPYRKDRENLSEKDEPARVRETTRGMKRRPDQRAIFTRSYSLDE